VADEPDSALDVSVQAQVLDLLNDLQQQLNLTYLFITHDLAVVMHIRNQVAVMYFGRIVEMATTNVLFHQPHPCTEALISAVLVPDPDYNVQRVLLRGDVPNAINPSGWMPFSPALQLSRTHLQPRKPFFAGVVGWAPSALSPRRRAVPAEPPDRHDPIKFSLIFRRLIWFDKNHSSC